MTRQELFDMVYRGLASQNWQKCVNENGMCVYRGPDGLKCAAGHVFTDEDLDKYAAKHNNVTLTFTSVDQIIGSVRPDLKEHSNMLQNLQSLHDFCPGSPLKPKFDEWARTEGLAIPTLP